MRVGGTKLLKIKNWFQQFHPLVDYYIQKDGSVDITGNISFYKVSGIGPDFDTTIDLEGLIVNQVNGSHTSTWNNGIKIKCTPEKVTGNCDCGIWLDIENEELVFCNFPKFIGGHLHIYVYAPSPKGSIYNETNEIQYALQIDHYTKIIENYIKEFVYVGGELKVIINNPYTQHKLSNQQSSSANYVLEIQST